MNKLILLIAAAASLGIGSAARAPASEEKLTVAQDESSQELVLERYLTDKHNLVFTEGHINNDPKDLYLNLAMKGDPMPAYRVTIDTQVLHQDKTGRITQRGVRIQAYTGIKVTDAQRPAVTRVINDFNRDRVFAACYVDTDGEVMLDWTLNILESGLDPEYVFDVLGREDKLWKELYPRVTKAMEE